MRGTFAVGLLRRHRMVVRVVLNMLLVSAAFLMAFALRFDLSIPSKYLWIAATTLPLLLGCKMLGFWALRLFSGWWRHVSLHDVIDMVRANLLASGLFLATMVFFRGLQGFPRSIFLLDLLVCTTMMCGTRVAIRLFRELAERQPVRRIETLVLIVGAGSAGIVLLDEIANRRRLKLGVVGFVDDDEAKVGLHISGTPVLGRVDDLPALIAKHEIGEVLIAIPSAPGAVLRRIVQHCTATGVRHRVLPTLGELVEGRVMYTQMREVKVDDLLVREPVRLDLPRIRSFIHGKIALVTGAAGSIGSELCRQLAAYEPRRLVLYDRHENGMFALEMELRTRFPHVPLEPILGDILLEDQLRRVFAAHRPDIVFHAAAYKHVPLAEQNVLEAVRNNVLGTRNVAVAALAHGTKEFVLVSTDKAVQPTSVMGVTKRVAELVIQAMQNGTCRFVAVRFGNVLGSNGSVVPLFREQIARGGPVTVTHPEVSRYFMTIPEATQLVLQAATLTRGGEILVLEMGEPLRIADLARHMIELSGLAPDEDIEIVFTGLRPGEKLHEELVADDEKVTHTFHDRIKLLQGRATPSRSSVSLDALREAVHMSDVQKAVSALQALVPSYKPGDHLRPVRSPAGDRVSPPSPRHGARAARQQVV